MNQNIVLVRSMGAPPEMWEAQEKYFKKKGYNVYNYDYPIANNVDNIAKDLNRFYIENKIEKSDLIGCSLGGMISIKFAYDHPEKVKKLVLANTAPGGATKVKIDRLMWKANQWIYKINPIKGSIPKFQSLFGMITQNGKRRDNYNKKLDKWTKSRTRKEIQRELVEYAEAVYNFNPQEILKQIKVPTLIITGSHDLGAVKRGVKIFERMPKSRFITQNGGHLLPVDKPKKFNENVYNFIKPRKQRVLSRRN